MASVTSCSLARMQPSSSTDDLNRWKISLKYDVVTDGAMGHQALVTGAQSSSPNALPSYGATYSYQGDTSSSIYLQTYGVECVDGTLKRYVVTTNYAPPPDGDITIFEPNPFLRDPVIWFDREAYTRVVERDVFGKAIRNKARRPYDVTLEEEDVRTVIVVEFNVGGLTASGGALQGLSAVAGYARFLRNAVNSGTWLFRGLSFPARTVLAREVASTPPIVEGVYTYYRLSFRFVVANGDGTLNPNATSTWDAVLLERGYQAYRTPNNPGSLTDVFPEPVLLKDDGTVLDNGDGSFTTWRVKREVDFNLLPFSG